MSFDIGATVAGKYQIRRVLGQGGMGTLFLATHCLLNRSVALKILRSDAAGHPVAAERLLQEGRALARLRGDHIARVLDVEAPESGPCFLVLEYLEGEDLAAVIGRSGPLPVNLAVTYIIEACEALSEAHAQGIVHRDIKPSNLFLTTLADGSRGIKVIDFGISKQTDQATALTQSRSVVGSPCYMAPEQMRSGGSVDARCDIWSLGVVLYELLTGHSPHAGTSMLEICACILESAPMSPKALRPEVPSAIDAAVRKCLARDPDGRFASVSELAGSIAQYSGTSTERLAWILPAELEAFGSLSCPDAPADGHQRASVANQTEADDAQPVRRKRRYFHAAWILAVCLGVVGMTMVQATNRRRVASAPIAQPNLPTPPSIEALAPRSEPPQQEVAPMLRPSQDSDTLPNRGLRRSVVSRGATFRTQQAAGSGAPVPMNRPISSASAIEQDPVLQYGHY